MKLLPLTTRKQLLNPHRASHQVSKSTHLCMITQPTTNGATYEMSSAPDSKTRSNWNPSQATGFVAATVLFSKIKKPSLPVNDHRVWGCLIPIATTLLVAAPAVGTTVTVVLIRLSSSYAWLVIFFFFLKSDSKAVGVKEISYPTKRFGTFKPSEFTCSAAQLVM